MLAGLGFSIAGGQRRAAAADTGFEMGDFRLIAAINEGFGSHENVLWLLDNRQKLELGATYFAAVANFVPRAIWPEKPLGGGPRLRNMIKPGSYVVGERGNTSYTTGVIAEAMMNFGWLGVIIIGIFHGIAISFSGKILSRARDAHAVLIGLFFVTAFGISLVYSEFSGWLTRNTIVFVALLFSRYLSRYVSRASHRKRNYRVKRGDVWSLGRPNRSVSGNSLAR